MHSCQLTRNTVLTFFLFLKIRGLVFQSQLETTELASPYDAQHMCWVIYAHGKKNLDLYSVLMRRLKFAGQAKLAAANFKIYFKLQNFDHPTSVTILICVAA